MEKYIIDCDEQSNVYRTYQDSLGRMFIQLVPKGGGMLPYTEPDTEQVREESYQRGYSAGKVDAYDEDAKKITKWIKKSEEAYQNGMDAAWEAARKILKYRSKGGCLEVLTDVFSNADGWWDIINKYTASEATAKIWQYEQEKKEIKVGDEITDGFTTVIVTKITDRSDGSKIYQAILPDGEVFEDFDHCRKTGRHFAEIVEALEKLKEATNAK